VDIFAFQAIRYLLHGLIIGSQKYPVRKKYRLGGKPAILICYHFLCLCPTASTNELGTTVVVGRHNIKHAEGNLAREMLSQDMAMCNVSTKECIFLSTAVPDRERVMIDPEENIASAYIAQINRNICL